tara:strand:- start:508 stop:738 length:231 start_codon:yes stop_codon:yes gene_type:complete
MMSGGKDAAMIILGKGKGKRNSEPDDMMDEEDEYEDEEMEEYSDEQYEMADELISAVKGGNSEAVLDAIHGIYNSY